jgi:predicted nucleic acid-binding protein
VRVDASAVIELLLSTPLGRLVATEIGVVHTLHAPELLGVEVVSVLRRLIAAGEIDVDSAERVIAELGALGVEAYEHAPLLGRMLALRNNLTAYDAAYVALAKALDAVLLTCDSKIAGATGHSAAVKVVAV